ncbi:MAG: hypothetical protein MJA29_11795, partial [Candidatus Omnitrophica bacterium]|nr:hypothetical protein [Candidatus Omnitrophota bacterium]
MDGGQCRYDRRTCQNLVQQPGWGFVHYFRDQVVIDKIDDFLICSVMQRVAFSQQERLVLGEGGYQAREVPEESGLRLSGLALGTERRTRGRAEHREEGAERVLTARRQPSEDLTVETLKHREKGVGERREGHEALRRIVKAAPPVKKTPTLRPAAKIDKTPLSARAT